MKRILLITFLFLLPALVTEVPASAQGTQETTVYICTGKYATKYHKTKKCKGLNNCKGEIKGMKLSSAKAKKYTACKVCYK